MEPSAQALEKIRNLQPRVSFGQETDQQAFTGERFLPGYADGSIDLEHVHRYAFALPFVADCAVLDIACGEGYGCDLLAQAAKTVTGVDISETSIALARGRYERANLAFEAGGATAIPLRDHSVDVVVSFETIEHLDDQDAFWSEIRRVLRPGGLLILSSPNREGYGQQRSEHNPFHKHELTQQELVSEISRRFAHQSLFSQSVVFGSLLLPCARQSMPSYVVSLDPVTRTLQWESDDERSHPYSVALASDAAIPEIGLSLYTGRYPRGAMSSLVGGIIERDQTAHELRQRIAELETSGEIARELRLKIIELESSAEAARQVQEELTLAAKKAEEKFMEETRVLTSRHDQALVRATRLTETLAEQDRVIQSLKAILEENTYGSGAASVGESGSPLESKN